MGYIWLDENSVLGKPNSDFTLLGNVEGENYFWGKVLEKLWVPIPTNMLSFSDVIFWMLL